MRNWILWLPWVGAIVVAGIVGGVLGVTGVFGHPTTTRSIYSNDARLSRTAQAYECPGGAAVTPLQGGDRVVAIARSADSSYLGVRNPLDIADTVWVKATVVAVDRGQQPIASLPIGSCPDVTQGILMPPTNHGTTPTTPTNPTKPTKPVHDTTPPTEGTPTAATAIVCNKEGDPPFTDTISVTATDNVAVTGVAISWSGATSGSGSMTHSGSKWIYVYNDSNSSAAGTVTFQVRARDAAGNLSAPNKVNVTQGACVG